jgi:acyl-CoA synthetase (AMP-forming)/AMP-acid ligase II
VVYLVRDSKESLQLPKNISGGVGKLSQEAVKLIHRYLDEPAKRRPEAIALLMGEEKVTYSQLESASNQLAKSLIAEGCKRGDRVAILLAKSPLAIVSILGILKADCIYVPLDVSSPMPRLLKAVVSCAPRGFLVSAPHAGLLPQLLQGGGCKTSAIVGGWIPGKEWRMTLRRGSTLKT